MPGEPTSGPTIARWVLVAAVAALLASWATGRFTAPTEPPSYSEIFQLLDEGRVEAVELRDESVEVTYVAGPGAREQLEVPRLPRVDESTLIDAVIRSGADLTGKPSSDTSGWLFALLSTAPFLLLIGLFWFSMRSAQRSGPLSFGKSQAKIHDENQTSPVTFLDVAGVDEAKGELMEVVDFLKNPDRYRSVGAKMPKGVLLVGPPGTGKTLLARAVAGEAAVPFFSINGSAFVEMFVGVGAARMRSLFEQAKSRAPCIVFIDEIDAVGKSRGGVGAMGTHDEREQTLNQLLAEMDGFEPNTGVVLMAATNRPEVLDPALLRAGRFDRQVVVDRPDVAGREAILAVHVRDLHLDDTVRLALVARRTPGMVGADLARVANEAALAAVRRGSPTVGPLDFDEAIDRLQLGLKKQGRCMSEDEKERVAVHESGHALVALSVEHADPVHRVSIIPRSIGALGVTLQLPEADSFLATQEELLDRVCVALGGRAAEKVVLGSVSTGAENDLEQATGLARLMVARFGMSDEVGPVSIDDPRMRYLAGPFDLGLGKNVSEDTARKVDAEVTRLLREQLARAHEILTRRRGDLERLRDALLEKETLDRPDLDRLIHPPDRTGPESDVEADAPSPTSPLADADKPRHAA